MSASLVGSEMCIRDRSEGGSGARPRTRLGLLRRSPGHEATGTGTRRPSAVSYTHLTLPTICSV
eukprot:6696507-Alexandrium_andersonii.AAC.1